MLAATPQNYFYLLTTSFHFKHTVKPLTRSQTIPYSHTPQRTDLGTLAVLSYESKLGDLFKTN